jgi:protein subunit release factor A
VAEVLEATEGVQAAFESLAFENLRHRLSRVPALRTVS